MKSLFLGLCFCLLVAQQASAACADFEKLIDTKLKEIAQAEASGFLDNSAPRATMRNSQVSAGLQYITLMITQMQAAKCPVSNKPYDSGIYMIAASRCETAKTDEIRERCNKAEWKPYPSDSNKEAP